MGPELAVADGALGFWQAIEEVWPHTRSHCWVHKTANVLNKLPKSQQPKAKRTHLSLDKDAPIPRAVETIDRILSRPVVGGLHHEYVRI